MTGTLEDTVQQLVTTFTGQLHEVLMRDYLAAVQHSVYAYEDLLALIDEVLEPMHQDVRDTFEEAVSDHHAPNV